MYYAITIGEMKNQGEITSQVDGKEAHSKYELVKSVLSPRFGKLNFVQLNPKTGKRRQLLVHLSNIGNPILGDKEYGIEGLILDRKNLYLHV